MGLIGAYAELKAVIRALGKRATTHTDSAYAAGELGQWQRALREAVGTGTAGTSTGCSGEMNDGADQAAKTWQGETRA